MIPIPLLRLDAEVLLCILEAPEWETEATQ